MSDADRDAPPKHRGTAIIASLCLLATVSFSSCYATSHYRTAYLYHPPAVAFDSSDVDAVQRAIIDGMTKLRWIAVIERPGVIRGTLNIRRHVAIIVVNYTSEWYQISYAGSDNLRYQREPNGVEFIHKNYNAWISNLTREINARLPAMAHATPPA